MCVFGRFKRKMLSHSSSLTHWHCRISLSGCSGFDRQQPKPAAVCPGVRFSQGINELNT